MSNSRSKKKRQKAFPRGSWHLKRCSENLTTVFTLIKGGSQHDAQEFLLWLLDRVHEDLNMASRRLKRHRKNNAKYDSDKDDRNPTDEVLAAESLANYMRSNNSFVMDVFQV